ncbi:hypothetical protein SDC9_145821 [bioreactor metagenome]|uniref:Uncharacterized protein n=1 Tax=bioreactor metagenome TaxID=1076179 RepID=A0A645ED15_9ZZZZ
MAFASLEDTIDAIDVKNIPFKILLNFCFMTEIMFIHHYKYSLCD